MQDSGTKKFTEFLAIDIFSNKEERRWIKTLSSHMNNIQSVNGGDRWRVRIKSQMS